MMYTSYMLVRSRIGTHALPLHALQEYKFEYCVYEWSLRVGRYGTGSSCRWRGAEYRPTGCKSTNTMIVLATTISLASLPVFQILKEMNAF
eukprot:scaffold89577_cov41-Prasinocladus_malaysianus.AAC.1